MSGSQEVSIEELMEEGLNQYAMGDDARAMACWQRVLEIDPEHAEAKDYLRTASGSDEVEPAPEEGEQHSLLDEAIASAHRGETSEALELLESFAQREPDDLRLQTWIELCRCALLETFQARLAGGVAVPQLRLPPEEIIKFNLPPDAGYVLASIDGTTSVNELLEIGSQDPFETLRTCCKLLDAGIIEVSP